MRFPRFALLAGALPFAASGLAFLIAPQESAGRVGIALASATADADVRALFGGLQLACAALLALAARRETLLRPGLAAQIALYAGLASGRCLSLALAGAPSALGFALLGMEGLGLAAGVIAWRRLAAPRARAGAQHGQNAGVALSLARTAELAELLPLVDAFQREEGYASGDSALRETVGRLLGDPGAGRVLIAREAGRAIGYAALCFGFSIEFRGRDAFVDELYVVPEKRGAGLGRALLRALEAEARAAGVGKLHLEVEQGNEARRLYVQEGFAAHGRELLSKAID